MLVLTRKSHEQIRIGDDIVVSIIRIKGNAVQVGIEAPRAVKVMRGELLESADPSPAEDSSVSVADRPVSREAVGRPLRAFVCERRPAPRWSERGYATLAAASPADHGC